jgi:hypothetical protein
VTDRGKKTYHSSQTPDIFGVFGVVTQARAILDAVIPLLPAIRQEIHCGTGDHMTYCEAIRRVAESRHLVSHTPNEAFSIIHGARFGRVQFALAQYDVSIASSGARCNLRQIAIPQRCGFHMGWASGSPVFETVQREDAETDARGLSRWQWQTFCDAVGNGGDPFSGGAPQLVGLYRNGQGRELGVYFRGVAYYSGVPAVQPVQARGEFRDELFQRVDADGRLFPGAQRHVRNQRSAVIAPFPL